MKSFMILIRKRQGIRKECVDNRPVTFAPFWNTHTPRSENGRSNEKRKESFENDQGFFNTAGLVFFDGVDPYLSLLVALLNLYVDASDLQELDGSP